MTKGSYQQVLPRLTESQPLKKVKGKIEDVTTNIFNKYISIAKRITKSLNIIFKNKTKVTIKVTTFIFTNVMFKLLFK